MNRKRAMNMLKPFVTVLAVVAMSGLLVFAIRFGALGLEWITFLSGVLAASLLAVVVRATRAEFFAARRLARLTILQERLAREKKRWEELEKAFAAVKATLHFSDEALPLMVAYVDTQARYRYHNRAFRDWLGLRKEKIDGQHMRDVHGRKGFGEIEAAVARAMEGQSVQFEWTQKTPGAPIYRLSIQYLPRFDEKANLVGFYSVTTDLTDRADARAMAPAGEAPRSGPAAQQSQELFVDSGPRDDTASTGAVERIAAAIKKGEFSLLYQPIRPLQRAAGLSEHYEIFVRLLEEESNSMPPGAFFPLAEELGLLPQLDRWVVEHLLAWMSSRKAGMAGRGQVFFLNIAPDTIGDPDFPEFVEYQLRKSGIPGSALCFEITQTALSSRRGDVEQFARLVKQSGCRMALTGFGREGMSVDLLKTYPVDFLKIHGSVILGLQRNPGDLGKLLAISRISKVIGISTVAEMVETEEAIAQLREINVDFAQGFGIAKPQPLARLGA